MVLPKVSAAYSAGGQNVLNEVSFKIAKGEKVGIVGRTGAGKVFPSLYFLLGFAEYSLDVSHFDTLSNDSNHKWKDRD